MARHPSLAPCLATLHSDPDEAAEIYVSIHRRFVEYFTAHRYFPEDELADEVLDVLCRYVRRKRIRRLRNPEGLAYRIAERIGWRESRRHRRDPAPLGEIAGGIGPDAEPDPDHGDRLHECMERCLKKLEAKERRLILEYEATPPIGAKVKNVRKALARRVGITTRQLHKRAFLIRRKLNACIDTCVQEQPEHKE